METQANRLKIPAWVPEPLKKEILGIIQPTDEDKREWATLKRLVTDSRMKRVWAELTKHRRDPSTYQTTKEPFHKPADLTTGVHVLGKGQYRLEKLDFEGALRSFFYAAYYHIAVNPVPSMTPDEAMKEYEKLSDIRKHLVEAARLLRNPGVYSLFTLWRRSQDFPKKHFSPDRQDRWINLGEVIEALEELARFPEDAMTKFNIGPFPPARFKPEGERPVVKRRTARESTRTYILVLANTCKELFNSPLYSTVATTASVALREKITPVYVMRIVQRQKR